MAGLSLRLVAGLLLAGQSLAVPMLKSRTVSSSLFSELSFYEQYAAAAYCSNNYDSSSTGSEVSCDEGNCDDVETDSTKTLVEFENSDYTDVTGFVAVDTTKEVVVVSFRGSSSIRNYIEDLEFELEDVDLCDGCQAHYGFWDSWVHSRESVLEAIESSVTSYSGYSIVVTGHSLGGAIATLATCELRNLGYTVAMYTYGSPRVGNTELATYITNQTGGNYRVTHTNDIVPRLPPHNLGYYHVSPEYWITSGNGDEVTAADIKEVQGIYSTSGNSGVLITSITSHLWYFNSIAACADFTFKN